MADLIRRSDVIGLLEDMLLFGEYDIIASSFSKADEEKAYRAINDIPAVNQWISVEDALPEFTFEIADDGGTIYKRIAEVFDRSAAEELVRSEIELARKRAPIIAVDFDGTLCENEWPGIGKTKWATVQALIAARAAGARLILWTNRVGPRLAEAVEWCRQRELEFDAVNENLPEVLAAFVTDCRKVYADIYLDDRAAQPSTAVLEQLWETARGVMNGAAAAAREGKAVDENA